MKDALSGWDEIAGYLRIDVRTAQRYERTRALPVRRKPRGGPKSPVFALKTDLDGWLLGVGIDVRTPLRNRGASADDFAGPVLNRIVELGQDTKLYRRDYHFRFFLSPATGGIQAKIQYQFRLCNATDHWQPFIQELTVDDSDHGMVESMSFSANGKSPYAQRRPKPTKKLFGYVLYEGPKQLISPRSNDLEYVCSAAWTIQRGSTDIWYNHMVLPTIGVQVETRASAGFEITPSFRRDDFVMKGEHLDIAWRKRS